MYNYIRLVDTMKTVSLLHGKYFPLQYIAMYTGMYNLNFVYLKFDKYEKKVIDK